MPGRRPWLPDCSVWRRGSVRHRHGLRRLRRALHVPAVSASAIALTAASLIASAADVVRRLVHLRHQRRVPGWRAGLAHRHVRRASAVRLGHGLLRLWRPLYVSTLAAAFAATFAAAYPAAARAAAALAAAFAAAAFAAAAFASSLAAATLAAALAAAFAAATLAAAALAALAAAALAAALAAAALAAALAATTLAAADVVH
mgnify:CR=1 FL=1